jgi:SAM-dependent methyltransferase
MTGQANWKPSKAVLHDGRWRASRDPAEVTPSSRMIADLQISAYADAIMEHAAGTLVDLGCGKAPYRGIYRDRVTRSIGVDWPSSVHGDDNVDVVSDLNERIDLPDESADTILCTDVLEHIYRPEKLWTEMFRIARPGACGIIGTPFFYWLHETPHDFHRYTSFALRRYAQDAGFEVVSVDAIGGHRHVVADLLLKRWRRGPRKYLGRAVAAILTTKPPRPSERSELNPFPLAYIMVVRRPRVPSA